MKTLLLSAKYFAIKDNSSLITTKHLEIALENLEIIDKEAEAIIKNELPNAKISIKSDFKQSFVDEAASMSKIGYESDVKLFVEKLKNSGYDTSNIISKLHFNSSEQTSIFAKIKEIKEELSKEALGQRLAIESICDGLMRAEYKSVGTNPHAVFLFSGPKSPAKNHIAKELSKLLSEYSFQLFKMSSYGNGNGTMQLFGTPEPYSGAKEGLVTKYVKEHPKSIIVFEDIELADNDSFTHLAKIVDEGMCTDSFNSKDIDFTQTIVIFTTSTGKEVYLKHEFMMMAQKDQKNAESMILDAISREESSREPQNSNNNGNNTNAPLFDSTFMSALRQSNIALFGKLGFSTITELVKRSIIDEFTKFESTIGIKLEYKDLTSLAQLLILSSGPEFDMESIRKKMPSYVLDIVTDSIIENNNVPKTVTISVGKDIKSMIENLITSNDDMKLLNTLFRKNQTLSFVHNYDLNSNQLEFNSPTLEKIKRAKDYGDDGGFSIELPDVTFDLIAGHHKVKERLQEAIRILKSKELSSTLGEHMPKGMLLYGPPGTGKTMLAKAFAKEADLPFIATTGPDMLDERMMKKVFEKARDYAPAIVFIDEIDVFKHRGHGYGTDFLINKLLTLIDGFSTNEEERIFIVAATNLKENIDSAIIRSGRIDLHILVDYLDKDARLWFIDKMLSKSIFDTKIDKDKILRYTANMSGADLQKIESESILFISRKNLNKVTEEIVMEQINSLKYGIRIEDSKLEIMLTRTAYHEAGHAIISKILMPEQKIEQITVTPRSNALGFVSYDTSEYYNQTLNWFQNRMCVCYAGRAAEVKQYQSEGIESGASGDLKTASSLANYAIAELGMDDRLRNVCKSSFGDNTIFNKQIEEISLDWITKMSLKTDELVNIHWSKIDRLAKLLIDKEIVEDDELDLLINEV